MTIKAAVSIAANHDMEWDKAFGDVIISAENSCFFFLMQIMPGISYDADQGGADREVGTLDVLLDVLSFTG